MKKKKSCMYMFEEKLQYELWFFVSDRVGWSGLKLGYKNKKRVWDQDTSKHVVVKYFLRTGTSGYLLITFYYAQVISKN